MGTFTEEHSITGDKLIEKIKELIHETNVRHIIIKNDRDEKMIEIPMAVGMVGVLLMPVWAAIGAIAALAANLKIVVVRDDAATPPPPPPAAPAPPAPPA